MRSSQKQRLFTRDEDGEFSDWIDSTIPIPLPSQLTDFSSTDGHGDVDFPSTALVRRRFSSSVLHRFDQKPQTTSVAPNFKSMPRAILGSRTRAARSSESTRPCIRSSRERLVWTAAPLKHLRHASAYNGRRPPALRMARRLRASSRTRSSREVVAFFNPPVQVRSPRPRPALPFRYNARRMTPGETSAGLFLAFHHLRGHPRCARVRQSGSYR